MCEAPHLSRLARSCLRARRRSPVLHPRKQKQEAGPSRPRLPPPPPSPAPSTFFCKRVRPSQTRCTFLFAYLVLLERLLAEVLLVVVAKTRRANEQASERAAQRTPSICVCVCARRVFMHFLPPPTLVSTYRYTTFFLSPPAPAASFPNNKRRAKQATVVLWQKRPLGHIRR